MMRKLAALILVLWTYASVQAQDITLTFDNPENTNDGSDDFYEVDVYVVRTSSSNFKLGIGQFYLDYNTDAFGTFIDDTTVDFEYVPGSILSEQVSGVFNIYATSIINDNDSNTVSISWQQLFSASSMAADNVTDIPTLLGRIKMKYIDVNELPEVCFNVSGAQFDDQFFTACGPFTGGPATANCIGVNAGTQIFDYDGSNCSGAELPISCSGVTTYTIGAGWDNGIPTSTIQAIISEDYDTADGNLEACELVIAADATLTIRSEDHILVSQDLVVDGDLVVEHQGSVVQIEDHANVINNGSIEVYVDTPDLDSRDFMIMGSPMTMETRQGVWTDAFLVLDHHTGDFVPNADVAADFPLAENFADDNYNNWKTYASGIINPAEGYLVRPQTGYGGPGGIFNYVYTQGTLNTGDITFNVLFNSEKNDSPNVLANPYPSAISANDFISSNPMVDEVYFWEHLTPPSPNLPGAGAMNFSMEDISMYNLTGGTAAASDGSGVDTQPNGVIATGQGFAIKANAAGTALFNNSMRLTSGNTTLRAPEENRERIWISIKNEEYDMQSTTLIGFSENASAAMDASYDSRRIATVVSLYSHLEDGSKELGIQSRERFDTAMKIPMGFSSLMDADLEYTISISQLEGMDLTQAVVYLEDLELQTMINLSETDYSFTSKKGTYSHRFILRFEPGSVLETLDESLETLHLFPNPAKTAISVNNPQQLVLDELAIYDVSGRLVLQKDLASTNRDLNVTISELSRATYLVVIKGQNGVLIKQLIKE